MTVAQYIAAASGLIVLAWPHAKWLLPSGGTPAYRDSIYNLSQVRLRLLKTQSLGEDQKRAIDVLTLALVDGSDQ
jgi:hypothetical protein